MSDTTTRVRRAFLFNGARLADPDPSKSPDEVRKYYAANGYPTLTNASLTGPETKDGMQVYTLKAAVGTKG
jgi:PRTRC genetic system protein C